MLESPEDASREAKLRAAADWLSQRMQGATDIAARRRRYTDAPPIPTPTEDPIALARCLKACDSDAEERERDCRRLRNPRVRLICWGTVNLSATACRNSCNWRYGG